MQVSTEAKQSEGADEVLMLNNRVVAIPEMQIH